MEVGCHSDFMSLQHITLFISLLNSSTNSLPLYLLPLAALLNSWTNSSIVLPLCSNIFNSATFTVSSSPLPNSFLRSAKNSLVVSYSSTPPSKSSSVFSFYISANLPCIYDKIHCIYSSTVTPFIFIIIYNYMLGC